MQNGHSSDVTVNGTNPSEDQTETGRLPSNGHPAARSKSPVNGEEKSAQPPHCDQATPRGHKRKHSEVHSAKREKKLSPPWKKVEAEGVTSFVEDGKRKSSRTNAVPLELRPPAEKRQTRREYGKYHDEKVGRIGENQSGKGVKSPLLVRTQNATQRISPKTSEPKPASAPPSKRAYRRSGPPATNGYHTLPPDDGITQPVRDQQMNKRDPKAIKRESHQTSHSPGGYAVPKAVISSGQTGSTVSPETAKVPRIRLRLGPRLVPILNPLSMPPRKNHGSLRAFLEQDDPLEALEFPPTLPAEIQNDARAIARVIRAGKPGQPLDDVRVVDSEDDTPKEYFGGYTHPDYLNKHVADFQIRLLKEGRDHRATAKRIALAAQAAVKARIPKTPEEIEEDKRLARMDFVRNVALKEFRDKLDSLSAFIRERKRAEFEAQEAAAGRDRMRQMVDRSEGLLTARAGRRSIDAQQGAPIDSDSEAGSDGAQSLAGSDEVDEDDDSEDPNGTSGSSDEGDEIDLDKDLSAEQLRAKYSMLPPLPPEEEDDESQIPDDADDLPAYDAAAVAVDADTADADLEAMNVDAEIEAQVDIDEADTDPSRYELEEVDDVLMDDDDASDSDDGTATSSEESIDGDSDESESEEEDNSLLGFLSKQDIRAAEGADEPVDTVDVSQSDSTSSAPIAGPNLDMVSQNDMDIDSEIASGRPEQLTISEFHSKRDNRNMGTVAGAGVASQASQIESTSPVKTPTVDLLAMQHHSTHSDEPRTAIPSLLRGQLRPYQHAGLDWLARMYAEDTNGILADEMGLGKTFQTIALLAHLATHHQVWGPHLVVVPTSVMLNWEMEFKKFCPGFKILTYYGTQEERRAKRKGWFDNDRWHVCITSYQLALQDAVPLKRRGWHYLILDEAHNIKNFRSQRWQTLLSFKSQARLLLTGTPLQNNLSELWSLLFFLAPEQSEDGTSGFGSLQEFSKVFHQPVDQILEHGRGVLDADSMNIVNKLHKVLRPHLLRRMKADVEKQMPKKYEHITVCRLSKRQRQLYDSYMGLAGTRDSFASGNYMSIINCLMQLRKVCNHPDLFETRQIVTSFAMPKSAVADYEISETLVRRNLTLNSGADRATKVMNLWGPNVLAAAAIRRQTLSATYQLDGIIQDADAQKPDHDTSGESVSSALAILNASLRDSHIQALDLQKTLTTKRLSRRPVLSQGLVDFVTLDKLHQRQCNSRQRKAIEALSRSTVLQEMILDLDQRSEVLGPAIQKFGCVTPAAVAPNMSRLALTDIGIQTIRANVDRSQPDPFHEARMRLSIAFPDKSLIQYDCGKLQQLDKLLRRLQSGGHRALIFTQMTKVLDILEQFMNLHGHRYLRLDGATKIEQRQVLTERFNTDPRILAFILSSRSGGLGINLTGADTVIFYDLDWNPAMDKQCQDRCHRIGQTRDVHIYRFVSEGTIEANILRKSNQKRMLDDVVIQEGDFTTEYLNKLEFDDGNDEANAALDKLLGGGTGQGRVLQQAEDTEDQEAAKLALKEDVQTDAADFDERPGTAMSAGATTPGAATSRTSAFPVANADTPTTPATPNTPAHDAMQMDTPAKPSRTDAANTAPDTDVPASTKEQLYEAFASTPLPQDKPAIHYKRDDNGALLLDEQGNAETCSWEDYLLRLLDWDNRDLAYAPMNDEKRRKKAKKGLAEWSRIRR